MKQEPINYEDLIELGFKQHFLECSVHKKQHGYDDFVLEKKLSKKHCINWEHSTRFAELLLMKKSVKDGFIQERFPIKDLDEVKKYMKIFGKMSKIN